MATPTPEQLAQIIKENFDELGEDAMMGRFTMGIQPGHHNLFETYIDVVMAEIQCAICDKTVDRVEREKNYQTDSIRYKVYCHGDTDTCELTQHQIENCNGRIEPGYAFTTKRVEPPEERSVDVPNVLEGSCCEVDMSTPLLPTPNGETD